MRLITNLARTPALAVAYFKDALHRKMETRCNPNFMKTRKGYAMSPAWQYAAARD